MAEMDDAPGTHSPSPAEEDMSNAPSISSPSPQSLTQKTQDPATALHPTPENVSKPIAEAPLNSGAQAGKAGQIPPPRDPGARELRKTRTPPNPTRRYLPSNRPSFLPTSTAPADRYIDARDAQEFIAVAFPLTQIHTD